MARQVDYRKREEIAQAAFEILRSKGFQKTSMSEIAKALGMKRPTLYWYFKDIGAIFETLLVRLMLDVGIHMEAHIREVNHPIDRLFAQIKAVDDFFATRESLIPCLLQLWAATGAGVDPEGAVAMTRSAFEPRRQLQIESVRAGIREGLIDDCDPEALVHLINSYIDGMLVQRISHPETSLPPVHDLIWTKLLNPLKLNPIDQEAS